MHNRANTRGGRKGKNSYCLKHIYIERYHEPDQDPPELSIAHSWEFKIKQTGSRIVLVRKLIFAAVGLIWAKLNFVLRQMLTIFTH